MFFTVFCDCHLLMSWTFPFTGFHCRKLLALDGGAQARSYRAIHLHRRLLRPAVIGRAATPRKASTNRRRRFGPVAA
jgi:hypothetical protein